MCYKVLVQMTGKFVGVASVLFFISQFTSTRRMNGRKLLITYNGTQSKKNEDIR